MLRPHGGEQSLTCFAFPRGPVDSPGGLCRMVLSRQEVGKNGFHEIFTCRRTSHPRAARRPFRRRGDTTIAVGSSGIFQNVANTSRPWCRAVAPDSGRGPGVQCHFVTRFFALGNELLCRGAQTVFPAVVTSAGLVWANDGRAFFLVPSFGSILRQSSDGRKSSVRARE